MMLERMLDRMMGQSGRSPQMDIYWPSTLERLFLLKGILLHLATRLLSIETESSLKDLGWEVLK